MAQKKSIRFWGDWQVRAVWDEVHSKWWFSAIDIVRAINDEDDYVKSRASDALDAECVQTLARPFFLALLPTRLTTVRLL